MRSLGLIGHATITIPRGRKKKGGRKSHAGARYRVQGVPPISGVYSTRSRRMNGEDCVIAINPALVAPILDANSDLRL